MDALLGRRSISLSTLTDFSNLDSPTKKHLKNVYACMALSTLSAGIGAFCHVYLGFLSGFVGLFGPSGISIGFMLAVSFTENHPKNQLWRLGYLMGFSFFSGTSLGPLIRNVIAVEPTIVSTAFFSTCLIFVAFTLSALWAERRSYMYLGGMLMSGMFVLCGLGLANIFLRSQMIFQLNMYGGLAIFCAFILYDTQLIIEKFKMGDRDFIWHSVDLYLDFVNIFVRLMSILSNKEQDKKKKRKN